MKPTNKCTQQIQMVTKWYPFSEKGYPTNCMKEKYNSLHSVTFK